MRCFQCVHWDESAKRCGKLELKVRPRTIYTQGGYPWNCEFCRKPNGCRSNPFYEKCPYMEAEDDREDEVLNHPKCPKASADRSRGKFCDCALVRRSFIEYPSVEPTRADDCCISRFNDTPEVAKRTLDQWLYVTSFECPKALVNLLISRGYPLTKAGWVRSGAKEITIRDLIRNLGDAEMKALEATPRTGRRLVDSISQYLDDLGIGLYKGCDGVWKYLRAPFYDSECIYKEVCEIRKEVEAENE